MSEGSERALGEGISAAMNATAAMLVICVPSVLALLVIKRRRRPRD